MEFSNFALFLPEKINTGPWAAGYAVPALAARVARERIVLPICGLGTQPEDLAKLGGVVLPPLYHEALDADAGLKADLVAQIRRCFPFFEGTRARAEFRGKVEVVELSVQRRAWAGGRPKVLALGVDTTVEQHGPHLPLATDTIQTYAVLRRLAAERAGVYVGPALEYGHLTWGLPFGLSVDLTAPLLARYVRGFLRAVVEWCAPEAIYVADVHGSLVHRETIKAAVAEIREARAAFRWLHDPLVEFAGERGDMHAGGVETALVELIDRRLVDEQEWPRGIERLAAGEMTVPEAVALSADMAEFIARVESQKWNGIVGRIHNAFALEPAEMFERMVTVARKDVGALVG